MQSIRRGGTTRKSRARSQSGSLSRRILVMFVIYIVGISATAIFAEVEVVALAGLLGALVFWLAITLMIMVE